MENEEQVMPIPLRTTGLPWVHKMGIGILVLICLVLFSLAGIWVVYPTTNPLTTISDILRTHNDPHLNMKKQVIGFLPYWEMKNAASIHLDTITQIDYFSLTANGNGDFVTQNGHTVDPGWSTWNSQPVNDLIAQSQIEGDTFIPTVSMLDNKEIIQFLNNNDAQARLIQHIKDIISAKHLNGVTIDVEYTGDPGSMYKDAFTLFMQNLSTSLHAQNQHVIINITLPPLAARAPGLFDLSKLVPLASNFIGMSYDYYGSTADIAGPVAPMSGFASGKFFFDIETTYTDFLKMIPKEKVIMGIPYYGWDWAVKRADILQSATLPPTDPNNYAAIVSYARSLGDPHYDPTQTNCEWDVDAEEELCWYTEHGIGHQAWFENDRSLQVKYTYARMQNLSGIAIWALGYEGDYQYPWDLLQNNFSK